MTINGEELYPEESRSLDSLRQMRLVALLRDMIKAGGWVKTAETLGVSYRTVVRAEESGRLTGRMGHALERHLLLGGGSAAARQQVRVEALEKRVAALEGELRGRLEAVEGGSEAMREEQARAMRQVERRLVRLEAGQGAQDGTERVSQASLDSSEPGAKRRYAPMRVYRDVVTLGAEPDEDLVYGEATPVIVEWRGARAEFIAARDAGTVLNRAVAQGRMLEMEIELIGKHELTLPPRTYPWDQFDRRDQVRRREQSLEEARVERNRALLRRWLRRAFTLGLWRD